MAKDKQRPAKGIPNRHLHARTTFLYQAATYLTLQTSAAGPDRASEGAANTKVSTSSLSSPSPSGAALHLASHLRAVSLKGQIRLSSDIKRTICKICNTILIAGRTSTHVLENNSRGGRKPWADVLVVECNACGGKKRFPVGTTRQQRKPKREMSRGQKSCTKESEVINQSTTVAVRASCERPTDDTKMDLD